MEELDGAGRSVWESCSEEDAAGAGPKFLWGARWESNCWQKSLHVQTTRGGKR